MLERGGAAAQVVQELRRRILAGDIEPGSRLAEAALGADFRVSRTPIRIALEQLAAQGLVDIAPNQGAVVPRWRQQDLEDTFEIRALVEGWAAGKAALRSTERDVALLEELCNAMDEIALASMDRNIEVVIGLDEQFHDAIAATCGNRQLVRCRQLLVTVPALACLYRDYAPEQRQQATRDHREIYLAIAARDAQRASELMASHVGRAGSFFVDHPDI